jgi:anti-sigma regulatory factor (Ser/Thr protein kinase)
MTIQDSAPPPAFAHMIYPYAGERAYLSGTLTYIDQARTAGAAVVIATTRQRRALLSEHLDGEKDIVFMDTAALGRNPSRLIPAWQDWIGQVAKDRIVHGVNEPSWASTDGAHQGEARYREWLLNRAFAQAPAWSLLCPVETTGQQAAQIEAMTRCHPLVWNGTAHQAAADYLVDAYRFDELPEPPAQHRRMDYQLRTLQVVRERVADWADGERLPERRTRELILVASELATNSIRYGGGRGTLRMWTQDGALVCEFSDDGLMADPLVGQLRPSNRLGGRGLWIVNQLSDLVQIRSAPGQGTRIRIWIDLVSEVIGEPEPAEPDSVSGNTSGDAPRGSRPRD